MSREKTGCSGFIGCAGWIFIIAAIVNFIRIWKNNNQQLSAKQIVTYAVVCVIIGLVLIIAGKFGKWLSCSDEEIAAENEAKAAEEFEELSAELSDKVSDIYEQSTENNKNQSNGETDDIEEDSSGGHGVTHTGGAYIAVECKSCGAKNEIHAGSSGHCEYCGSPLKG